MTYRQEPAIQNGTGACFYCDSSLVDVKPLEVWELHSGQLFVKVKCSNRVCEALAWRPGPARQGKPHASEEKRTFLKVTAF